MPKVNVEMVLCNFCWDFHHQYMKGVPFKNARKEGITECWLCQEAMCGDCLKSSQKELQDDPLALYGLTMCQRCITQVRRLTTRHKEYEEIARQGLERFKAEVRKEIYNLTKAKDAVSN